MAKQELQPIEPGVERVLVQTIDGQELEQITTDFSRYYKRTSDGRMFISITHLLDAYQPIEPHLLAWFKQQGQQADEIRDKAGEEGSHVHEAIHSTLGKTILDSTQFNKKELRCLTGYKNWHEATPNKIELWDERVFLIEELGIACTADRIIQVADDIIEVIDYKTSKSISDKHKAQVVAQVWAVRETFQRLGLFKDFTIRGGILHIGNYTQKRFTETILKDEDFEKFEKIIRLAIEWKKVKNPTDDQEIEQFPAQFRFDYTFAELPDIQQSNQEGK